uniref:BOLA class I histocompatibility antigen, alpha chain BL3-7-like n=1 Tax=Euleptes europaea TaxID=460621 RepID=UPI0025423D72|nr:BOLA class I histocompatibility antigen, alpha chain BL3-7-like [Euleptes europaea]
MNRSVRGLWLLGGVVLLLMGSSGSTSHSFRNFYTGLSESSLGLPQFMTVGYVDDQPIARYDSHTHKKEPIAPWMSKVDSKYWEEESMILQGNEELFRTDLATMRNRFNQSSGGFHNLQLMYGCEVGPDRQPTGGKLQFAYDGEDFIAFDMQTLTWTAPVPQALQTKRNWDADARNTIYWKSYLEEECVEWLRRYLDYGKETLLRTEAPTAKVARKAGYDGRESLICRAHGFYPREIEVTWMKDGEDRKPDTFTGGVFPNSDGTYHTWLSIEVDPRERDRYRCRVEHDGLLEPLDLAYEDPTSNLGHSLGILGGLVLAVNLLGIGVLFYRKKRQKKGYKATARSDQGSDTSSNGLSKVVLIVGVLTGAVAGLFVAGIVFYFHE